MTDTRHRPAASPTPRLDLAITVLEALFMGLWRTTKWIVRITFHVGLFAIGFALGLRVTVRR